MTNDILPTLKYDANGLIPAIVQDHESLTVLMMAYMNADSLRMTIETGRTHFWSRSRKKFWMKGETSGHVQEVKKILYDCDLDTLLIQVDQKGPGACHTGHRSCFYTSIEGIETECKKYSADEAYRDQHILDRLSTVIHDRKMRPADGSYVSGLFGKGKKTVIKKVGEEATEVVMAATGGSRDEIVSEMADLWFHSLVLLEETGVAVTEVFNELERRRGKKGKKEGSEK